jgi:dynein heavy chain
LISFIYLLPDNLEELEQAAQTPRPSTQQEDYSESSSKAMLRDEFLINMSKFASSISRTIQQIEGEVKLECPELQLSDSMKENLKNETLMKSLFKRLV